MAADAIILAILLVFILKLVKLNLEYKRSSASGDRNQEATVQRVAELEERVKVLEAIVTDQSYELKRKINAL